MKSRFMIRFPGSGSPLLLIMSLAIVFIRTFLEVLLLLLFTAFALSFLLPLRFFFLFYQCVSKHS